MEKVYRIYYRKKYKTNAPVCCTEVTAPNRKTAIKNQKIYDCEGNFSNFYKIVKVEFIGSDK